MKDNLPPEKSDNFHIVTYEGAGHLIEPPYTPLCEMSYHKSYSMYLPVPVAESVECPLRGTGDHGFDTGPRHTKFVKMVLAALRLALRLTG